MRIGAHVRRGAGGVAGAIEEARRRGADCAQVFLSNPRGWAPPHYTDDQVDEFKEAWAASGLTPLFAHAPYLVNIASAIPEFLEKSRELARTSLATCARLRVDALVVHAGTGGDDPPDQVLSRAAASLRAIAADASVRLVVELEEGIPAASASTVAEAARLFESAGVPDLGLCLDTCHLFATGYALDTPAGVPLLFDELHESGLSQRVALIHANDAMFERGSHRDRHANIGDGHIGIGGFRALLTSPEAADLAFVLETPGDAARHAADIALLRSLAAGG